MSDLEITVAPGDVFPGGGPPYMKGTVFAVPFGPVSAFAVVMRRQVDLMGWSIRESTGLAAALADIIQDPDPGGTLVGSVALAAGVDAAQVGLAPATNEAAVAAPAANGVIVGTGQVGTGNPWPVGLYRLQGEVRYGAAAGPTDDFKLVEAGLNTIVTLECPPVINGAPTPFDLQYMKTGSSVFQVQAIAGSAGNYIATLGVTPIVLGVGSVDTRWFGPDGIHCYGGVSISPLAGTLKGSLWVRI